MADNQNAAVPAPSGSPAEGADESTLFADVFANSALLNPEPEGETSLNEEGDDSLEESDDNDDDLEESDDANNEDDDDEGVPSLEGNDEDDDDDESSTDDDDDDDSDETAGEIDWEFEVPVKVDGEELSISLDEMKKGYSTQKHLSKQGRELGDERKAFETEKTEKMEALVATSDVLIAQTMEVEKELATKYTELTKEHKQLKEDGDKFGANDKRDEIQELQAEYWKARNGRETLEKNIKAAKQNEAEEAFNKQVEQFAIDIQELIPDFDPARAAAIREFALEEGISEEILNTLANASAVKLLDDFRQLKDASTKGAVKKKKIPKKKSTPMKKPKSSAARKNAKTGALSKKLATGEATEDEGFDLLRSMASKHF